MGAVRLVSASIRPARDEPRQASCLSPNGTSVTTGRGAIGRCGTVTSPSPASWRLGSEDPGESGRDYQVIRAQIMNGGVSQPQ